jgi:hypothetical protein
MAACVNGAAVPATRPKNPKTVIWWFISREKEPVAALRKFSAPATGATRVIIVLKNRSKLSLPMFRAAERWFG